KYCSNIKIVLGTEGNGLSQMTGTGCTTSAISCGTQRFLCHQIYSYYETNFKPKSGTKYYEEREAYDERQADVALCYRNGQASAQASHKSLVPYSAESSDSESETTAAKQKTSLAMTPVKNGFAKENSSSAKFSNCTVNGSVCKTSNGAVSVSASGSEKVVNGWHVTVAQRNPSACYSPPQNWDVIDTSKTKSCEKEELGPLKKSPAHNGINGREDHQTTPKENGHSLPDTIPDEHKNGVIKNGRIPNGKNWDGSRSNGTVEFLRKNSHQGYGTNVSTWNGNRTQVDRDVENDRNQQRKRSYDHMYDNEYDQGKSTAAIHREQLIGSKKIISQRKVFATLCVLKTV
ncbi:hypothetical protein J6590_091439, partial [Homalodisca vitripennis]